MTDPGDVDPFDLPGWLGDAPVTWRPDQGIRVGHLVRGLLSSLDDTLPCDLLAVDEAYPQPVSGDDVRTRTHQAWRHGQVLLLEYDARLTLAVPGRDFSADRVLDTLARLARAVGASADDYAALLRLGADRLAR
ncbi:MAG: hypothetical protein ABIQ15_11380 [Nocardioides sp.]